MTITREQVADLQPGDVVELTWPDGTTLRGPVVARYEPEWLYLGPLLLRANSVWSRDHNLPAETVLTVVSRAPRPLYVNHPRTSPVPGDVVRGDGMDSPETWSYFGPEGAWALTRTCSYGNKGTMPSFLRLLVDGETGQVVQ